MILPGRVSNASVTILAFRLAFSSEVIISVVLFVYSKTEVSPFLFFCPKERRPARDVQGTPQYLESESNSLGNLNGSERLPGSVLLARARLVQRLRGVSLTTNRSVQMESSFHSTDGVQVSYECNKKPHGLTQGAINGLHRLTFSSAGVETERRDCSICLESFTNGDMLISLPCTHSFHSSCLNPWLIACGDCPYCRRAIAK